MYYSILGPMTCRQHWGSHRRGKRVEEVFGDLQFEKEVTEIARPFLDASRPETAQIGFRSRFAHDYIDSAFDSTLWDVYRDLVERANVYWSTFCAAFQRDIVARDHVPLAHSQPSRWFAFICLLLGENSSPCKRTLAVPLSPWCTNHWQPLGLKRSNEWFKSPSKGTE